MNLILLLRAGEQEKINVAGILCPRRKLIQSLEDDCCQLKDFSLGVERDLFTRSEGIIDRNQQETGPLLQKDKTDQGNPVVKTMASISSFGKYTHVIVRCIPSSFGTLETAAEGSDGGTEPVDLAKAHRQYGVYTGILRQKLGLQVIELAADEGLPCSTLVGDLAVIQGDTALLTRPWVPSRRDEISSIKKVLEELKLRVVEVTDEGATLDGSDVLFTGREFFVGISKWTNHRGAEMVADAFRDFAVSTIPVSGTLHLRSFCSMAGSDTVVIGSSEVAKKAMKTMEQLTDHHYETLTVPDDPAANCIYARLGQKSNVLLHRSAEEYPNSVQPFQKLPDYTLIPAACTEVAKLGGTLSSCSLLINKKLEI